MSKYNRELQNQVIALLQAGTVVLGMKLCFRNVDYALPIPDEWRLHVVDACLRHKDNRHDQEICAHFAQEQTNQDLIKNPRGMIRRCPFGYTEILTPVLVNGLYAGPLFAGPCWVGKSPAPHRSLIRVQHVDWLQQRLIVLNCIAAELSSLFQRCLADYPRKRREQIIKYLEDTKGRTASLHELAARLNLSPTRTTHLVREIFHTSLPLLARQHKLVAASSALIHSELLVGEISRQYGFSDQNYFSRVFSETFGMSPQAYRKARRTDA